MRACICWLSFAWMSAAASVANSHQIPTHRNITRVAVEYLKELEPASTCKNLDSALQVGTAAEDERPKFLFHFLPRLTDRFTATCSSLQWGFSSALCTHDAPLNPKSLRNTHTFQDAVTNAQGGAGLVDLGYVVHLLEDLTSPAHTRNDAHPPGNSDPFEATNGGRSPTIPPEGNLLSFLNPQDFFTNLQSYTQSNFFSSDTAFNPLLPGPLALSEDDKYFYDQPGTVGRRIAYKGIRYRWSGIGGATPDRENATIDRTIAREQFNELGPITVRYVASFIKHYIDLADPCPGGVMTQIVVDGDPSDWSGIVPIITDVVGNDPPQAPEDFISLRITNDELFIYFLVEFANNIRTNVLGNLLAVVFLDTDKNVNTGFFAGQGGGVLGVEFGLLFYGDSVQSILTDSRDGGGSSTDFPGVVSEAVGGRFIEVSIPISAIETITPNMNGFDFIIQALSGKNGVVRYTLN